MKKSSVKDQGKPDETDARDDDKDIRDKMKKIDVKSFSSTNSSSSMAKNSALLPGGVARVKQQEARRINQTRSSSSGSATDYIRNQRDTENPMRLTERHFPSLYIPRGKNRLRRCVICSKNDKRSESRYECKDCNVGLCIDPCFKIYHTQLHY